MGTVKLDKERLDLALGIAEDVSEEMLILLRLQGWKETG